MKTIVLLGAPGAGKGTQAKKLCDYLDIPHVSTGDIFRHNIEGKTALGREAEKYISQGNLVPDELTNRLVESRLHEGACDSGFVLDGFPRTVNQADALKSILHRCARTLDAVIDITIPEEEIIERLLKRAHIEGRADDTREVITRRISVYHQSTEPLLAYYEKEGLLCSVDGHGSIDDVWQRMKSLIAK
ncbi:MAG: adenylate kinase [Actinomycetaceae bacterium]|nr:adenylate kinase [Actinomycetaceae bacterium]